jgi:hypothetical protein
MYHSTKSSTWKNCAYVYLIPSENDGNLIVESFTDYRFEVGEWDLSDYYFPEYTNKLIGFFVTLVTSVDYWGEVDSEIILSDIKIYAEDGKIAYLQNLMKFDQLGLIDLSDFEEFFGIDNAEPLLDSMFIEDIPFKKPLFDLEELQSKEPLFLKYTEKELKELNEHSKLLEFTNDDFSNMFDTSIF